jgi:hypothetical protein
MGIKAPLMGIKAQWPGPVMAYHGSRIYLLFRINCLLARCLLFVFKPGKLIV